MILSFCRTGERTGVIVLLSVGLEHELIEGCLFSLLSLFNPSSLHSSPSDVFPLVNHCGSHVKSCRSLSSEIIVQVVHQVLSLLPEPSVQRSVSEGQMWLCFMS